MDADYYREYYKLERHHWWFRARSRILAAQIERVLAHQSGRPKILNVGAALGASSEMLARYGDVVSVEYNHDCCRFVSQHLSQTFVNASITDLPFPAESFDLVCAFDVVEHVADDVRAVAEMARVCRRGGVLALTVPAFMLLWSHHDVVNHHVRRYRLPQLQALFRAPGNTIFASYFNSLLFPPIAVMRAATKLIPPRWIRKGAGSDFTLVENSAVDTLFYHVLSLENVWLRRGYRVPAGVSACLVWRKGD